VVDPTFSVIAADSDDSADHIVDLRDQPAGDPDPIPPSWSQWRPARTPTCRKGWCPTPAAEGSDWCAKHLEQVTAQRSAAGM
jgi:hypothetical protein